MASKFLLKRNVFFSSFSLRNNFYSKSSLALKRHYASVKADSSRETLPAPEIRVLAQMARISVTEEQVKEWEPKIAEIVDWFDQLKSVNLTNVPPQLQAGGVEENRVREDVAEEYSETEMLINMAPDREYRFFKVPKILSE